MINIKRDMNWVKIVSLLIVIALGCGIWYVLLTGPTILLISYLILTIGCMIYFIRTAKEIDDS